MSKIEEHGNPFADIKQIETSSELIDLAFSKAMKIKPPGSKMDRVQRSKTHEINRINSAASVFITRLGNIVAGFPSLNLIHPFYYDLSETLIDLDELRQSLGRISGLIVNIKEVEMEIIEKIHETNNREENKKLRKQAFGRFSSMVNRINKVLIYLNQIAEKLKVLPGFNPYHPTVVVCGIPNAGKSSFVKLSTSGNPEIASYPFTTKKLIFGHRDFGFLKIQFVDTPGLLDRPISERNEIELQALTALKHLSDVLIFLIDPTPESETEFIGQINLMKEIYDFYTTLKFIPVMSKDDLVSEDRYYSIQNLLRSEEILGSEEDLLKINTQNLEGSAVLIDYLDNIIKNEILKDPKFRTATLPFIAEDQFVPDDEDYEDVDY